MAICTMRLMGDGSQILMLVLLSEQGDMTSTLGVIIPCIER